MNGDLGMSGSSPDVKADKGVVHLREVMPTNILKPGGTAESEPTLRTSKSGLFKKLTTKLAKSSSSLRAPLNQPTESVLNTKDGSPKPPEPEKLRNASKNRTAVEAATQRTDMSNAPKAPKRTAETKARPNANMQVRQGQLAPPTTQDRRRAEALHSLGLLPASRRYSTVMQPVYVEPKAEGGKNGMSAANVIMREYLQKFKEGESKDGTNGEADDGTADPIVGDTDVAKETSMTVRQNKPPPLPHQLTNKKSEKAKLGAWKFPAPSEISPEDEMNEVDDIPSHLSISSVLTSSKSVFPVSSSPTTGSNPALDHSSNDILSSPTCTSAASRCLSDTQSTPTRNADMFFQQSGEAGPSAFTSLVLNPSTVQVGVNEGKDSPASDKVNEWLNKTPVVSRPASQPASPSGLSSGIATPRASSSRKAPLTISIDTLNLPPTFIPLPFSPSPSITSPRLVPLPDSPIDSQVSISPCLVPLPSSVESTPSLSPSEWIIDTGKSSTALSSEASGMGMPSLSPTGTSATSASALIPITPISPLDLVAPVRSVPPTPEQSSNGCDNEPSCQTAGANADIGNCEPESIRNRTILTVDRVALVAEPEEGIDFLIQANRESSRSPHEDGQSVQGGRKVTKRTIFGRRKNNKEIPPALSIPQIKPRSATSFTNIRKSVIGSLTSSARATKLPLRHLTDPSNDSSREHGRSVEDPMDMVSLKVSSPTLLSPSSATRFSPRMHSRASIMMEADAIEDEESRRLSEMAFLDF